MLMPSLLQAMARSCLLDYEALNSHIICTNIYKFFMWIFCLTLLIIESYIYGNIYLVFLFYAIFNAFSPLGDNSIALHEHACGSVSLQRNSFTKQ